MCLIFLRCVLYLKTIGLCVCFYGSFSQVYKKKKWEEKEENEWLLKVHISGMADTIYFRSAFCSFLICWHMHSKFGLTWRRDRGVTIACKIVFCFCVNILTFAPACFLGPHNTLLHVLIPAIMHTCANKSTHVCTCMHAGNTHIHTYQTV